MNLANIDHSQFDFLSSDEDPTLILKSNNILLLTNQLRSSSSFPGDDLYKVVFYEDSNNNGDDFGLGKLLNPTSLDFDRDLTQRNGTGAGNWNDQISSVDSPHFTKPWVLFEHIGFGGNHVIGLGGCDNVPNGWNDKASSVAMSSINKETLLAVLCAMGVCID